MPESGGPRPAHLKIQGLHFVREDGSIYKGLHVSAFRSLELWLDGNFKRLNAWHDWLRSLGVTGQRVFAYHNPGHDAFLPSQYPDYYDRLPKYFDWMAGEGFYVHFVAHLGAVPPGDPFLTYDAQLEHWLKVGEACKGKPNVLLEGTNEFEDNNEQEFTLAFPKIDGVLCCRSRMFYNDQPWEDAAQWDWLNLHPERKDEENVVRQMRGLNELSHRMGKPIIAGEPEQIERMRADQQAPYTVLALMFGEVMTIHGAWESLQQCRIPTGEALKACELASAAFKSGIVPPEASEWAYVRDEGAPLVYPGPDVCQHYYAMVNGSRAIVGLTEQHQPHPKVAKPGWTIVASIPDVAYYLEAR